MLDTTSATIQILAFPRRATPTGCPSSPPVKKEYHPLCVRAIVVVPLLSVTLSRMPLQLYDLPFDMLKMIGKSYDDLAQREAASTLPKTPSPNPLCVQCLVQPFSLSLPAPQFKFSHAKRKTISRHSVSTASGSACSSTSKNIVKQVVKRDTKRGITVLVCGVRPIRSRSGQMICGLMPRRTRFYPPHQLPPTPVSMVRRGDLGIQSWVPSVVVIGLTGTLCHRPTGRLGAGRAGCAAWCAGQGNHKPSTTHSISSPQVLNTVALLTPVTPFAVSHII